MVNIIKNNKGKVTALGMFFGIIFIMFVMGAVLTNTEKCIASSSDEKYITNITIKEGDTLWEVASEHMDEEYYDSVYEYMDEIKTMNNMNSDDIYAGQNLVISYYKTSEH